jgi:hypothetical protein
MPVFNGLPRKTCTGEAGLWPQPRPVSIRCGGLTAFLLQWVCQTKIEWRFFVPSTCFERQISTSTATMTQKNDGSSTG